MALIKDTIMHFDFEGFGERNAIRSALGGNHPGGVDRAEMRRLLGQIARPRKSRAAPAPEQARAA
ncbi:MAG TPA: hypothetical protein PKD92_04450 [Novosphingobium sp.]|nr:hypothetical protein [Novosphingobium sp.]